MPGRERICRSIDRRRHTMNLIVSGIMSTPASSYSVKQGSLATCPGSLVPVPSPEEHGRTGCSRSVFNSLSAGTPCGFRVFVSTQKPYILIITRPDQSVMTSEYRLSFPRFPPRWTEWRRFETLSYCPLLARPSQPLDIRRCLP